MAYEGPAISARRFLDDFVIPDNCRDFNRCPLWFEPEWVTKTELLERRATDGWSKKFVDEVLEHEGLAAIPEYGEDEEGLLIERSRDDQGRYQIVWPGARTQRGRHPRATR